MIPRSGTGRRNLFIVAAIACSGLALTCGLSPKLLVQDALGYVIAVLVVFLSGMLVRLLRDVAYDVLPGIQHPWYSRPGALVFLGAILVVMTSGIMFLFNEMLKDSNLAPACPPMARLFLALAAQFAWIVILDSPQPSAYTPQQILERREPRRARHVLPWLNSRINQTYPPDSITQKRSQDTHRANTANRLTKQKRWRKYDVE